MSACVCESVCARVRVPSTCSHLSVKHGDSHPEHAPIVIASFNINFKVLCNLICGNPCTSRVLAWSSELFVPPLLGPGPSRHTQKRLLSTLVWSDAVRGAWAGSGAKERWDEKFRRVLFRSVCTCARKPSTCSHLSVKHGDSHPQSTLPSSSRH